MATHLKTLHHIASKLGLGDEDKVISKAAEFERLLQIKSVAGSNMTDTSKVVICLDLAAGLLGADLDVKTSVKFSGLKPLMYTNCKKMVQNLLELDSDKLTTSVLCAALQCMGVQSLADQILQEYQKQAKMELDLNLPQYVCMAVYHACRINKLKVPRGKMVERSRLKPSQWAKLDADWTKFVDAHFSVAKKKRGRPRKNTDAEPETMEVDVPQKEEMTEPQIEVYEDWKRRILETAYKELKELEEKELKKKKELNELKRIDPREMTPRRSPRKTPQKFSPYKSPAKANGVRLLFPLEI